MKATGIVRRIDDLGRVVIPKEIRRTMRLREGASLEIYTDKDGEVIFKKYSPIGELSQYAQFFSYAVGTVTDKTVIICDKDSIVSASGENKKDYAGKPISRELEQVIEARASFMHNPQDNGLCVPVYEGQDVGALSAQFIRPIICEGQTIGAVIVLSNSSSEKLSEAEAKSAEVAAVYLGTQMEQ